MLKRVLICCVVTIGLVGCGGNSKEVPRIMTTHNKVCIDGYEYNIIHTSHGEVPVQSLVNTSDGLRAKECGK